MTSKCFKTVLCIGVLLCSCLPLLAQSDAAQMSPLFMVTVNGKQGYIDAAGAIRIKPQFDGANNFSEGLAVVAIDKNGYKEGYINEAGKIVIPARFDSASDFSDGMAAVAFGEFTMHGGGDHHWGFINKKGLLVIPAKYKGVRDFSDGLAPVQNNKGLWGVINKAGRIVIPFKYRTLTNFIDGLACVFLNGKYGFIDREGRVVIAPQFSDPTGFSEGVALVRIGGRILDPSEGMFTGPLGGERQYIDKTGKIVIKLSPEIQNAHHFSDGLAAIEVLKPDRYLYCGYIDKTGQTVITPQYGGCEMFSKGIARIIYQRKFHYINKTGKIIISTSYAMARDFRDGLAWVQEGSDFDTAKYGYIDVTGKEVWRPSR